MRTIQKDIPNAEILTHDFRQTDANRQTPTNSCHSVAVLLLNVDILSCLGASVMSGVPSEPEVDESWGVVRRK